MDIKVSIVIPVYNREKQIEYCLNSLLRQTLKEVEFIIVNDGSTDGTAKKVEAIADGRIKLINTDNRGQGIARNTGIDAACGEYIGFVDSDDTVEPEMLELMYERGKNSNADMVQCGIKYIRGGESECRPEVNDAEVEISDSRRYVKKYFHTALHTNEVCNKIFKADFLRKNGLRFSDTREIYSEDLKFNIDLLEKLKKVCFVKEAFYNYYMSESGHFMKAPQERLVKICRLYEEALKNLKDTSVKNGVKSTAITHIFVYAASVIDTEAAKEVLKSKQIKNYLISAMMYRKNKYVLFGITFLLSPMKIRKFILKKMYLKYLR